MNLSRPVAATQFEGILRRGRVVFAKTTTQNRDLQSRLFEKAAETKAERQSRSAKVSRLLRLLKAHKPIQKVQKTHRYQLTKEGREAVLALSTAKASSVKKLTALAA